MKSAFTALLGGAVVLLIVVAWIAALLFLGWGAFYREEGSAYDDCVVRAYVAAVGLLLLAGSGAPLALRLLEPNRRPLPTKLRLGAVCGAVIGLAMTVFGVPSFGCAVA